METVVLKRHIISNIGTIGYIVYKGKFLATTLEHPWENNKPKISCIPVGEYIAKEDSTGKFQWWSVSGVPNRKNIEIHQGNRIRDTEGCILIGQLGKENINEGEFMIMNSVNTLKMLKTLLPKEFKLKVE